MASLVHAKPYQFHFPLSEQGVKEGCQQLRETLEQTRLVGKVKICLIFDSKDHPNNLFSVNYKRKITGSLTFSGLDESHKKAIKEVFQQLGISINSEYQHNGMVIQMPQGGHIVNGNSVSIIGIRGNLDSLRALFPGKSDAELQKILG